MYLVSTPLSLGQARENRFEIVLRELSCSPSLVQSAFEGLRSSGYLNYFGLQRFGRGVSQCGSHLIGQELIQSNWKNALDLMFTPLENDRNDILQAKREYSRRNYEQAQSLLPPSMYGEKQALERLMVDPKDYSGAYRRIPRNTQLICVHAFQSYIFNLGVTHRYVLFCKIFMHCHVGLFCCY